jgi:hypothetical protein
VQIGVDWQEYTVTFKANATVNDSRLQVLVGAQAGSVWLDDVRLTRHAPDVYQREFDNGLVLLNGSSSPQQIKLDAGYARLFGRQAPLFETLLDDNSTGFTMTGIWKVSTYDSGDDQRAVYHDWGECTINTVPGERAGSYRSALQTCIP